MKRCQVEDFRLGMGFRALEVSGSMKQGLQTLRQLQDQGMCTAASASKRVEFAGAVHLCRSADGCRSYSCAMDTGTYSLDRIHIILLLMISGFIFLHQQKQAGCLKPSLNPQPLNSATLNSMPLNL